MARRYRMKCPRCGNAVNVGASGPCPKCSAPLYVEQQGMLVLYRMGNFVGSANGFGIYLNEQPLGAIGNRETLHIPLPFGDYKMHIVCGMNRQCNDPVLHLCPEDPFIALKVHMKMGFVQNSFIIERVDPSTIPQV